jgi:hypothetical protein
MHFTEVDDDHPDVTEPSPPSAMLVVWSLTPKFSPDTVTNAAPLRGVFSPDCDITLVSNVNNKAPVPTKAPTVTKLDNWSPKLRSCAQETDVEEVQKLVLQEAVLTIAVRVYEAGPKFSPSMVTEEAVDNTEFGGRS